MLFRQRAVGDGGERDAAVGASTLLRGQDDVQHGIAGMLLRTVSLYRFFQLFESYGRMLRIDCARSAVI